MNRLLNLLPYISLVIAVVTLMMSATAYFKAVATLEAIRYQQAVAKCSPYKGTYFGICMDIEKSLRQ